MGYYYYLAPQLPYLVYGQEVPMSPAAFIALAQDTMSAADAAALKYCTLDPEPLDQGQPDPGPAYSGQAQITGSEFIDRWKEWERTLRLNLARGRALKFKREAAVDAPEYPADAALAAKNALAMESAFEAELFLDKARWNTIERFQGINVFSETAMYAYLLKLLLLERRAAFDTEKGFTEYKALYDAILGEPK